MGDGLWTPSTASSTTSILDGDAMEEIMRRSLEDNAYSVQGFWLCQARSIQQRRRRGQGRRRPRNEAESLPTEGVSAAVVSGFQNPGEATVEHHADEVRSYISALLHATGYPYTAAPNSVIGDEKAKDAEALENAALGDPTAFTGGVLEAPAPNSVFSSLQTNRAEVSTSSTDPTPLKAARVEKVTIATPDAASTSPAPPPKSALAKLVAKAKSQHRDVARNTLTVSVAPAPKNSAFPEDIPGTRLAQGSSARPAVGARRKVRFADESCADDRGEHAGSRKEGGDDSDEEDFGVQLPGHSSTAAAITTTTSTRQDTSEGVATHDKEAVAAKHPSQMTRAEFLSQFKRAPRRGEIGQSAEDIAAAERLGYVMSGSRSVASRMYIDRIQRQLHEHEAAKLQQQFRKVEDERMDDHLVHGLAEFIMKKKNSVS